MAEYAEILRESYWAQDGDLADVRALAQDVSEMLSDDSDVIEFANLVASAERIAARN